MSYEPRLVIKKSDLAKYSETLDNDSLWSKDPKEYDVLEFLRDVNKKATSKIDDIELVICQPELTSFNKLVRKKLQEWDVQFDISN